MILTLCPLKLICPDALKLSPAHNGISYQTTVCCSVWTKIMRHYGSNFENYPQGTITTQLCKSDPAYNWLFLKIAARLLKGRMNSINPGSVLCNWWGITLAYKPSFLIMLCLVICDTKLCVFYIYIVVTKFKRNYTCKYFCFNCGFKCFITALQI